MKTDLYTKIVLTIIAISLSGVAIQMLTKPAFAQSGNFLYTKSGALVVTVCDPVYRGTCADIINDGQLRISPQ